MKRSSGMLLAVLTQEKVSAAQYALDAQGITSRVIGRFVDGNSNTQLDAHEELWSILQTSRD